MTTPFYAVLGSHPALSELELAALLPTTPVLLTEKIARLEIPTEVSLRDLQTQTGGVVKFLAPVSSVPRAELPDEVAIQSRAVSVLQDLHLTSDQRDEQLQFSLISLIDGVSLNETHVKKALQASGLRVRFREATQSYGASAAFLLHHPLIELFIFEDGDSYVFAQTKTWQDIDTWTVHDRERPFADRKRGMLPLKVARMLVNIAVGQKPDQHVIYDPFCGAGSVLQEAMDLGVQSIGSDISHQAVLGTLQNLEWYRKEVLAQPDLQLPEVIVKDVAAVKPSDFATKPTAIVTEPFLGKQQAATPDLPNIYKGLYKLYKGAFSTWKTLLPSGGRIVIILPSVTTPKTTFDLSPLIDDLPDLGYNIVSGPVVYARPAAHTRRNVYVIEKK